jgi:hypothetical protein
VVSVKIRDPREFNVIDPTEDQLVRSLDWYTVQEV